MGSRDWPLGNGSPPGGGPIFLPTGTAGPGRSIGSSPFVPSVSFRPSTSCSFRGVVALDLRPVERVRNRLGSLCLSETGGSSSWGSRKRSNAAMYSSRISGRIRDGGAGDSGSGDGEACSVANVFPLGLEGLLCGFHGSAGTGAAYSSSGGARGKDRIGGGRDRIGEGKDPIDGSDCPSSSVSGRTDVATKATISPNSWNRFHETALSL